MSICPSLHYAETGRRPHVALAAAVGVSRRRGWLGGGGPNPFLSLSSNRQVSRQYRRS